MSSIELINPRAESVRRTQALQVNTVGPLCPWRTWLLMSGWSRRACECRQEQSWLVVAVVLNGDVTADEQVLEEPSRCSSTVRVRSR
jgi:hypothetical protein